MTRPTRSRGGIRPVPLIVVLLLAAGCDTGGGATPDAQTPPPDAGPADVPVTPEEDTAAATNDAAAPEDLPATPDVPTEPYGFAKHLEEAIAINHERRTLYAALSADAKGNATEQKFYKTEAHTLQP